PIRRIWDDLAESGLSSFLKDSGSTPGITLGVFEKNEEERIAKIVRVFAEEARPTEVSFWGLGTFPTDPAHVFLGVVITPALLRLHSMFLRLAGAVGEGVAPYYCEGCWVPHSTLAIRCNPASI